MSAYNNSMGKLSPEALITALTGYAPRLWNKKHILMLIAYIDDTTRNIGERRFYLCGYIHHAQAWADFVVDWDATLSAKRPIAYLKMSHANVFKGEFDGWGEAERDLKLDRLADVIKKHAPMRVEVSVSQQDLEKFVYPFVPYGLQNPYPYCFWALCTLIPKYLKENNSPYPVSLVFDDQGKIGNDTKVFFNWVMDENPELKQYITAAPVFADDRQIIPLQAADMLAWHVRRDEESPGNYPRHDKLGKYRLFIRLAPDDLKRWATLVAPVKGVDKVQDKKSWNIAIEQARSRAALGLPPERAERSFFHGALKRFKVFLRANLFGRRDKSP